MEDDVEENQLLGQQTKLPALRYFGLLLLIIVTLGLFIAGIVGAALSTILG